MPVVAAVERRCEHARGKRVLVGLQHVRDLVRILLVNAREGECRETFRGLGIEGERGNQQQMRHRICMITQMISAMATTTMMPMVIAVPRVLLALTVSVTTRRETRSSFSSGSGMSSGLSNVGATGQTP